MTQMTDTLERSMDEIKETWTNQVIAPNGQKTLGLLRWPSEATAKSQADKVIYGDTLMTEIGEIIFAEGNHIEQVKL